MAVENLDRETITYCFRNLACMLMLTPGEDHGMNLNMRMEV